MQSCGWSSRLSVRGDDQGPVQKSGYKPASAVLSQGFKLLDIFAVNVAVIIIIIILIIIMNIRKEANSALGVLTKKKNSNSVHMYQWLAKAWRHTGKHNSVQRVAAAICLVLRRNSRFSSEISVFFHHAFRMLCFWVLQLKFLLGGSFRWFLWQLHFSERVPTKWRWRHVTNEMRAQVFASHWNIIITASDTLLYPGLPDHHPPSPCNL